MNIAAVLLLLGLLLITLNEAIRPNEPKVIVKYIPRDMDAWFKDPENQPMYVYNDMFTKDNIRML
jgi:hypothetical protein